MQLLLATEIDPTMIASDSDSFSNLIGKGALWRRCRSLEKEGWVEEKVEATDTGSGHDAASAKGKEESGETVQEGDSQAPSPPNRGPTMGRRHQKRTT
jgi:hypothetical protein